MASLTVEYSTTVLPAYCDTGYCDKLLIVTVFVNNKRSKMTIYTVKSSVIVIFAYCDTFLSGVTIRGKGNHR